jgi:N-acetylglucosamine malate deacetylase 2
VNILAFFAHPDDETMLSGGTLALLNQQGAHLFFLCATRGEGGEAGEPPLCTRQELGSVRSAEMGCAVQALGGGELEFMSYIDPTVGPGDELFPFTQDEAGLQERLREKILQWKIDAVLTHGSNGEYGHPAHRLCHRAMAAAVVGIKVDPPLLYTVQAAFAEHPKPRLMNRDDPADLVLDVTAVRGPKTQAALCHRTQNFLFVRRTSEEVGHPVSVPEVIVLAESLHRVFPEGSRPVSDALSERLRQSGSVIGG